MSQTPHVEVRGLRLAYDSFEVLHDVSFEVRRGDAFVIMGGSGSGKSTLLNALIGLLEPREGDIRYDGELFTGASDRDRQRIVQRFGVLFQFGALWSGLTLEENVSLPLEELTGLRPPQIRELAQLKLALVGLHGYEDLYPNQLSGGMRKRAGLARAMALDPEILFLDEPSSGLDPVTARRLDELILELRDGLGTTIVVISHDLRSIFTIASDAIYLDGESRTITARGQPRELLAHTQDPRVRRFLSGGGADHDDDGGGADHDERGGQRGASEDQAVRP